VIPIFQTELGRGPAFDEPHGNCLQAAIASLLELPMAQVPHAVLLADDVWWESLQAWSRRTIGMDLVAFPACDLTRWTPESYHLITGKSPRGVEHATVGLRGRVVHDPHPSSREFAGEVALLDMRLQTDGRLWWFFIPINPARVTRGIASL